jgi:hypothetical protein
MNFKNYANLKYKPPVGDFDAVNSVEINFQKAGGNPIFYKEGLAKVHAYLYATSTAIFDFTKYTWRDNIHQNYYGIYQHIASTLEAPQIIGLTNIVEDDATLKLVKQPLLPNSLEVKEGVVNLPIPESMKSRDGLLVLINRLMLIAQMGTSKTGYLTIQSRPKVIVKSSFESLTKNYGNYDLFPGNDSMWIKDPPILLYNFLSKKYPGTIDTEIPAKWYYKEMTRRAQPPIDLSTEEEADWAV